MCGIAGYVGMEGPSELAIEGCLKLMRRRGPDHADVFTHRESGGRTISLLHSRLSIIDLDPRSNQPFRLGSSILAYNGELYNYVEVRQSLRRQGQEFETESDTEVLLRKLQATGWRGLDDCEGMWAFAHYDTASRALLLSRDRFGEKPLHVYRDRNGLYFGSEVKFIAALLGQPLQIDYDHLYRYLVNGYKSLYKTDKSFFVGVRELPPATALQIAGDGKETSFRYWDPSFNEDPCLDYADAVEGVRDRLVSSMRMRLRADVPLAFCMSGGIDSNSLISIAKQQFDYDVHGFTILNEDARYEEKQYVDAMVRTLGLRHTAVPLSTRNFLQNLTTLIRQHDAPVYTISYYVHWLLMQAVGEHGYRISVSGTAADELLSGYYDHHNLYLYEVRDTPAYEAALAGWQRNIRPVVRNPYLQDPDLYARDSAFRDHIFLRADEFAQYLRQPWHEPFTERQYVASPLRNRMLNELFHEAVPVILHEDDLNAMYFSIENRSPFLDRSLFEFSCRIPARHLVRDGFAKVVLRDAMAGLVPDSILWNARKVGFNAPILSLLDVNDRSVREWLLDDGPIYEHVRRDRIQELLSRDELPNSESKFLFYFVCSKIFIEEGQS